MAKARARSSLAEHSIDDQGDLDNVNVQAPSPQRPEYNLGDFVASVQHLAKRGHKSHHVGVSIRQRTDAFLTPSLSASASSSATRVRVNLVAVHGLPARSWDGASDPYCCCGVPGKPNTFFETWPDFGAFRTQVAGDMLTTTWDHVREVADYSKDDPLEFSVWIKSAGGKVQLLGEKTMFCCEFWPDGFDGAVSLETPLQLELLRDCKMDVADIPKSSTRLQLQIQVLEASQNAEAFPAPPVLPSADPPSPTWLVPPEMLTTRIRVTILSMQDKGLLFSDPLCICKVLGKPNSQFHMRVNDIWSCGYEINGCCKGDVLVFTMSECSASAQPLIGKLELIGKVSLTGQRFDGIVMLTDVLKLRTVGLELKVEVLGDIVQELAQDSEFDKTDDHDLVGKASLVRNQIHSSSLIRHLTPSVERRPDDIWKEDNLSLQATVRTETVQEAPTLDAGVVRRPFRKIDLKPAFACFNRELENDLKNISTTGARMTSALSCIGDLSDGLRYHACATLHKRRMLQHNITDPLKEGKIQVNQTVEFGNYSIGDSLNFTVWDRNSLSTLGEVSLPANQIYPDGFAGMLELNTPTDLNSVAQAVVERGPLQVEISVNVALQPAQAFDAEPEHGSWNYLVRHPLGIMLHQHSSYPFSKDPQRTRLKQGQLLQVTERCFRHLPLAEDLLLLRLRHSVGWVQDLQMKASLPARLVVPDEFTAYDGIEQLGMMFSGISPRPVFISKVQAEGWAEKVGLQVGSEVVAMNQQLVNRLDYKEFKKMLRMRPLTFLTVLPQHREGTLPGLNKDSWHNESHRVPLEVATSPHHIITQKTYQSCQQHSGPRMTVTIERIMCPPRVDRLCLVCTCKIPGKLESHFTTSGALCAARLEGTSMESSRPIPPMQGRRLEEGALIAVTERCKTRSGISHFHLVKPNCWAAARTKKKLVEVTVNNCSCWYLILAKTGLVPRKGCTASATAMVEVGEFNEGEYVWVIAQVQSSVCTFLKLGPLADAATSNAQDLWIFDRQDRQLLAACAFDLEAPCLELRVASAEVFVGFSLGYEKPGLHIIKQVQANGWAAAQGVKEGALIMAVDGNMAAQCSHQMIQTRLETQRPLHLSICQPVSVTAPTAVKQQTAGPLPSQPTLGFWTYLVQDPQGVSLSASPPQVAVKGATFESDTEV